MNERGASRIKAPPAPTAAGMALDTPVQFITGVGPSKASVLAKLGIETVADLLVHFPREHQDRTPKSIKALCTERKGAVVAKVRFATFRQVGPSLGQVRATICDESGAIEAIWFKRFSYKFDVFAPLRRLLHPGSEVYLYGSIVSSTTGAALRVEHAESAIEDAVSSIHRRPIVPVYPSAEGLNERWFREISARAVARFADLLHDPLPAPIREEHKLLPYVSAVKAYHFPESWPERDRARERLAFDEFFFLEAALALGRLSRSGEKKGVEFHPTRKLLTPFKDALGYEFTKAQARAINEIFRDMAKPIPMNRLLQGDVGSGKTVVALSAALLAVENGRQAAFLAPTEILAEQHALSIQRMFKSLKVRSALLTRSTPAAERRTIVRRLGTGEIDLLIGTHAILNEKVTFARLGLVVIDEQHRFGVRQRARLIDRSVGRQESVLEDAHPDVLIMTATPIPRTLALTLYGDLDVSVIDEMPPGRSLVETRISDEHRAIGMVQDAVKEGRQAFIVFPLIDESERLARRSGRVVKAAAKEFDALRAACPGARIGLLHGALQAEEKRAVMDAFRSGRLDVLVATPVIEVGIDVPNATHIVIMNPERFGLAQLHQLRGRVGRGRHAGTCLLIADDGIESTSRSRLDVFCAFSDGFRLAEEDLKLRGPGEILGEAQHGVPTFRVGNLVSDGLLIGRARETAKTLIEGGFRLTMAEFRAVNRHLTQRFGDRIKLSDVG